MQSLHSLNEEMIERVSVGRARYARSVEAQRRTFFSEDQQGAPLLLTSHVRGLPAFNPKEIHADREKMLAAGLTAAMDCAIGGREAVPSVRANMGCGIVPALFGVTQELYEDKMPWVREHLPKERLLEMTPNDLSITPEFRLALEQMEHLAARLAGSGCLVYPLDIQGAFDTAHLVYGDDIFYDLYDDPEFVEHLMDLSCAAIEMAVAECLRRMPGSDETVPHYCALAMPRAKGGVKLSEDTSTLLSEAHIRQFVAPSLHRLLSRFGGGYVHYCGENPHLYEAVLADPLAYGLNFGNPEKQDMTRVLSDCAARGMVYYGSCARGENETEADYFARVLKASRTERGFALLLTHACEPERILEVSDLWDEAIEREVRGYGGTPPRTPPKG